MTACAADDGLLRQLRLQPPCLAEQTATAQQYFRRQIPHYPSRRLTHRRRLFHRPPAPPFATKKWGNGGIGWVYPNTVKGQRMATVRYSGSGWNTISSRKSHSDFSFGGIEARADGGSVTLSAADGSMDMQQISIFGKPVWSRTNPDRQRPRNPGHTKRLATGAYQCLPYR